ATRDALTGLPNRALLAERTAQAILNAARNRTQLALLALDLDRFKLVNESLGHAAGDALLRAVAERLQNALRREDTLARLGGDDFALLWNGLKSRDEGAAPGEWTLERALAQAGAWQRELPGAPWFAVNVSAAELAQGELFADKVQRCLAAHALDGARIELEVTERVLMSNFEENARTLRRIGE